MNLISSSLPQSFRLLRHNRHNRLIRHNRLSPGPAAQGSGPAAQGTGPAAQGPGPAAQDPGKLDEWVTCVADDGSPYFYHPASGKTSWDWREAGGSTPAVAAAPAPLPATSMPSEPRAALVRQQTVMPADVDWDVVLVLSLPDDVLQRQEEARRQPPPGPRACTRAHGGAIDAPPPQLDPSRPPRRSPRRRPRIRVAPRACPLPSSTS